MMHFLLASVEVDAEREQPMRQRRLVGKKEIRVRSRHNVMDVRECR